MELKWDDRGLIPAVVQDRLSGQVRMVAWMNAEALAATRATGWATFFSRSRQALWVKGETSGHRMRVVEVRVDCDADTLLLSVEAEGPSCHTGQESCFFHHIESGDRPPLRPVLGELERTIGERATATAAASYTKSLLDGGAERIGVKLREEADELALAIAGESNERVVSEAADVIFHLLVALRLRGADLAEVAAELARRAGTSGHTEKARRNQR